MFCCTLHVVYLVTNGSWSHQWFLVTSMVLGHINGSWLHQWFFVTSNGCKIILLCWMMMSLQLQHWGTCDHGAVSNKNVFLNCNNTLLCPHSLWVSWCVYSWNNFIFKPPWQSSPNFWRLIIILISVSVAIPRINATFVLKNSVVVMACNCGSNGL